MKRKTMILILFCVAAGLVALVLLSKRMPAFFSSMMAFPFEQLAGGIQLLARTGWQGNSVAVLVWLLISGLPAMMALGGRRHQQSWPERAALFLLSGVILLALYGMTNPQVFRSAMAEGFSEYARFIKSALGVSVWAVVVLYMTLRLIRLFRAGTREQLLRYLRIMLFLLCIILTAGATLSLTHGLAALADGLGAGLDQGIRLFRLVAGAIPSLLSIVVIFRAMALLDRAVSEQQDGIVEAALGLCKISCQALGITAAVIAASNLIQLLAMRWLSDLAVTADIPVFDMVLLVMILLFARLLVENKRLRDDNSLII